MKKERSWENKIVMKDYLDACIRNSNGTKDKHCARCTSAAVAWTSLKCWLVGRKDYDTDIERRLPALSTVTHIIRGTGQFSHLANHCNCPSDKPENRTSNSCAGTWWPVCHNSWQRQSRLSENLLHRDLNQDGTQPMKICSFCIWSNLAEYWEGIS